MLGCDEGNMPKLNKHCFGYGEDHSQDRIGTTKKAIFSFFHGHACKGDLNAKTRLRKPESSSA